MRPTRRHKRVRRCRLVRSSFTTSTAQCLALCLACPATVSCRRFTLRFRCGVFRSRCRRCQRSRRVHRSNADTAARSTENDCAHVRIIAAVYFLFITSSWFTTLMFTGCREGNPTCKITDAAISEGFCEITWDHLPLRHIWKIVFKWLCLLFDSTLHNYSHNYTHKPRLSHM